MISWNTNVFVLQKDVSSVSTDLSAEVTCHVDWPRTHPVSDLDHTRTRQLTGDDILMQNEHQLAGPTHRVGCIALTLKDTFPALCSSTSRLYTGKGLDPVGRPRTKCGRPLFRVKVVDPLSNVVANLLRISRLHYIDGDGMSGLRPATPEELHCTHVLTDFGFRISDGETHVGRRQWADLSLGLKSWMLS